MKSFFLFLVHYPTRTWAAKKAKPVKAGSHYLHYHLNDLNTEKIPAQRWLEPQATCCLGMCHGSHTLANWGGIFFCILPYLNISDFLWLNVYFLVHYPTRDLQRSFDGVKFVVFCLWKLQSYGMCYGIENNLRMWNMVLQMWKFSHINYVCKLYNCKTFLAQNFSHVSMV